MPTFPDSPHPVKPKLLDRVRDSIRTRHYSRRTEEAYVHWIRRYIVFHQRVHPSTPFGGVGASGYGRDFGPEAIHDYTEAKAVWINVDATIPPFYKR